MRETLSEGDRKSTRLNSSHANISYAVFCLKKKNMPTRTSATLRSFNRHSEVKNVNNIRMTLVRASADVTGTRECLATGVIASGSTTARAFASTDWAVYGVLLLIPTYSK